MSHRISLGEQLEKVQLENAMLLADKIRLEEQIKYLMEIFSNFASKVNTINRANRGGDKNANP